MNNNELFLKLTREFERLFLLKYQNENYSAYYLYKVDSYFSKYQYELDLIRKIRNLLSHQREINFKDAFVVSPNIIERLKHLISLLQKPLTAYSIAKKQLLSATINDQVAPLLKQMSRFGFSFLPILDDKICLGILSADGVMAYLLANPSANLALLTIKEIIPYLALDKHPSKYFLFTPPQTSIQTLKTYFKMLNNRKKLALILVTKEGRNTSNIMGVIAPLDLVNED